MPKLWLGATAAETPSSPPGALFTAQYPNAERNFVAQCKFVA